MRAVRLANPKSITISDGLAIAFDGDDGLVVDASKMAAVSIQQVTMAAWVKGESSGNDGTTFESSMGVIMNKEVTYGKCSAPFASSFEEAQQVAAQSTGRRAAPAR